MLMTAAVFWFDVCATGTTSGVVVGGSLAAHAADVDKQGLVLA